MRADAGNVDDGFRDATPGEDKGKEVFDHVEATEIVDVDSGLDVGRIDVADFAEGGLIGVEDASIVDEEIQTTTMLFLDSLCNK